MNTIADLLPNEHILNFHEGTPSLPAWLPQRPLKLMMGAGDFNHYSQPNTQFFQSYDVFFCLPFDDRGSLRDNVEYLIQNHYRQKVICFLDAKVMEQVYSFTQLFAGRFELVDGHGGHTPHLSYSSLQKILMNGGVAVNIYEHPESIITLDQMRYFLRNGFMRNPISQRPIPSSCMMCRVYDGPLPHLSAEVEKELENGFKDKLAEYMLQYPDNKVQVLVDINSQHLSQLQQILYCLQQDSELPVNILGEFKPYKREWRDIVCQEFVLTKKDIFTEFEQHLQGDPALDTVPLAKMRRVIQAIKNDLENESILGGKMKLKTLNKIQL